MVACLWWSRLVVWAGQLESRWTVVVIGQRLQSIGFAAVSVFFVDVENDRETVIWMEMQDNTEELSLMLPTTLLVHRQIPIPTIATAAVLPSYAFVFGGEGACTRPVPRS